MKRIAVVLIVLLAAALPTAAGGESGGKKGEVISRIETLLEKGELDSAKEMIDYFLAKNPADKDLLRLLDAWRVKKGDVAGLFVEGLEKHENRAKLREAALRAVKATLRGNPEEWEAITTALPESEWRALLEPLAASGSPEDQRVAKELLDRKAPAPPPERSAAELLAAAQKGRDECVGALREAEMRKAADLKPVAAKVLAAAVDDAELRAAAAGLLAALGDTRGREALLQSLASPRPIDAVEAMQVLVRHPGDGEKPLQALIARIEESEEILGRVKPTLAGLALGALGRPPAEHGAREFLAGRLSSPDHCCDAARALGALGDAAAIPALLGFLRAPLPRAEEDTTEGGLGYLGGAEGLKDAAASEEVRPYLAAAIALLRLAR